jgi:tetratricopeptide (TPR) repeat protein
VGKIPLAKESLCNTIAEAYQLAHTPIFPCAWSYKFRMVYSPPSNQPKSLSPNGAKPHVVANEIDAGAIKLQPPKIRPINRPEPKRRTSSVENMNRSPIRSIAPESTNFSVSPVSSDKTNCAVNFTTESAHGVDLSEGFRAATTAKTVELISDSVGIYNAGKTVQLLTSKTDVIRNAVTTDFHIDACGKVRSITEELLAEAAELAKALSADVDFDDQFSEEITSVVIAEEISKEVDVRGVTTQWETPYNKPAFEALENIQYTRLALQYLQQGRIEDAERLYKQALVVAERTFPSGDPAITRAVEDLASFYYSHEKFKQAEPFVSRLLKQRVESLACDDWILIRTVDQLADVYEKCGEPVQAQALYKFLLARQEESVGQNATVCSFTLSRLAESYLKQEHFAAAESLLQKILGIQETLHGRSSIEISMTLQELASIYQKLGRYDRAAEMLERLLHILESIHGDNGLSVASCLLKLANLLTEIEMVSEAEPLYRRAQEIYSLSYGDRTAADSMIKKKVERVTTTMTNLSKPTLNNLSKLSKDKPVEQEECSRFPAIRLNLDDMLPSKLGTGQVSRCLGHAISQPAMAAGKVVPLFVDKRTPIDSTAKEVSDRAVNFDHPLNNEFVANGSTTPFLDVDAMAEMIEPSLEFSTTGLISTMGQYEPSAYPSFDFSVTSELPEEEFDFSSTGAISPFIDFQIVKEIIPPSFNFTPSFEIDPPNFDSTSKKYEFNNSTFESDGELDSILDTFFASELAKIYETTTVENTSENLNEQWLSQLNQQDTIPDLDPAGTLKLERKARANSAEPSRAKPAKSGRTTRTMIEAVRAAKPSRLADKTASELSELKELPKLTPTVPGVVTVTRTDLTAMKSQEESSAKMSAMQLRDTVREKPILLPEPFPSSRRKSSTQRLFAVTHPGTKTR